MYNWLSDGIDFLASFSLSLKHETTIHSGLVHTLHRFCIAALRLETGLWGAMSRTYAPSLQHLVLALRGITWVGLLGLDSEISKDRDRCFL